MNVEAVGVMVLNLNKSEEFKDIKCWTMIKL